MTYLQEFKNCIASGDFARFLHLWEEYSNGEEADVDEFLTILATISDSDFSYKFGGYVETALPLWNTVQDPKLSYDILKHLVDLQTTNNSYLQDLAIKAVKQKYKDDPNFDVRLKLVGLRGVGEFQGSLANYDLLAHMAKGKFVYHTGGWGTGEVMDISPIREQVIIEFENVLGKRDLSFKNAFKQLKPLTDDHFLARRFGDPDQLEEEAKSDPVKVVHLLLKDLGPKTAHDIKEEVCEWVIPEEEWSKWWQNARSKLKKDTLVEVPSSLRKPFILRNTAISHEERFNDELLRISKPEELILAIYNFIRDFPAKLNQTSVRSSIEEKLTSLLEGPGLSKAQEIQVLLLLDNFLDFKISDKSLDKELPELSEVSTILKAIPILAFRKRLLVAIRKLKDNWVETFLELLLKVDQNPLREYLYGELSGPEHVTQLEHKLEEMLGHSREYPETLVWYFQKIVSDKDALFSDKDGQCEFLEAYLILMHQIERKPEYRDLVKKMHNHLTHKRYLVLRAILEGSALPFAKELLLLVTKCQTFTSHDLKVMRSLIEVAHPSLAEDKEISEEEELIIWTTEEGYNKLRNRIEVIGTVEVIENAKEIEEARALGDLRENSEFKFAQERRARLQGELKLLSDQLNRARIITEQDVVTDAVSIGTIVDLINSEDKSVTYTILGPWDADPEENILSFQSKLAEAMIGYKVGEKFSFRHDTYTVSGIRSYL